MMRKEGNTREKLVKLLCLLIILFTGCTSDNNLESKNEDLFGSIETSFQGGLIVSTINIDNETKWSYESKNRNIPANYVVELRYVCYHGNQRFSFLYEIITDGEIAKRIIHTVSVGNSNNESKYAYFDETQPFDSINDIDHLIDICKDEVKTRQKVIEEIQEKPMESNNSIDNQIIEHQNQITHLEEKISLLDTEKSKLSDWVGYIKSLIDSDNLIDQQTKKYYLEIISLLEK